MTQTGEGERLVNLVVTNFSGGKRHASRGPIDGDAMPEDAMHEMVRLARSVRTPGGFVLAVQEMTTDDDALPTRAIALEEALESAARSSLVPRVSTAWYPLKEKWGEKIEPGGAHTEGLCVVTDSSGLALVPWSTSPWRGVAGPAAVNSPTRVVDLPNIGFPDTEGGLVPEAGWLQGTVVVSGTPHQVRFRPTFYRGTRDSDPRVAQSCLLGWLEAATPGYNAACVLVNIHLSTLTTELRSARGRVPTPEAIFLRGIQLDVIARYVEDVQEAAGGLPVVVAGDFNAEPGSPEMAAFEGQTGAAPMLSADKCWKCGTAQVERPEVAFYATSEGGWDFTTHPQSPGQKPELRTRAVCSNPDCLEPRFTHKWHGQLLDNVFILPARGRCPWEVIPGTPQVDVGWGYSDHAAIILPLNFTRRTVEN